MHQNAKRAAVSKGRAKVRHRDTERVADSLAPRQERRGKIPVTCLPLLALAQSGHVRRVEGHVLRAIHVSTG